MLKYTTFHATDIAITTPHACPRCGATDVPTVGPGSGPHATSARCPHCGHFLQWLSKYRLKLLMREQTGSAAPVPLTVMAAALCVAFQQQDAQPGKAVSHD